VQLLNELQTFEHVQALHCIVLFLLKPCQKSISAHPYFLSKNSQKREVEQYQALQNMKLTPVYTAAVSNEEKHGNQRNGLCAH
jgi:hypothetical protein